ncbi:uncharacterized protein [Venturia canescens]|uniref:uncharacterized protein n=1 Tax=Venturia canescens TaxID=32260 RepID=UPI001C9D4716|nr:uncharacterized protein LOC122406441 [Venturia canescens]XP_043267837.1 uncharacterized protein LOC122406441 [Venturia canescens]XP_043267844.1 uncharacterized protein LOC122406441 [Venturia canescens]XP_043267853.1 uncharacterized protein LOC122406441 [Venturia canescens]XP_043267862.1 uncharacterized protein LOC122406441 [Venturia canescens]
MSKRRCDLDKAEAYRDKILKYKRLLNDTVESDDQDGLSDDSDTNAQAIDEPITDENDRNIPNVQNVVNESEETLNGEANAPILSEKARELLRVEKRRQKDKAFVLHNELADCWKEIILSGMESTVKKSMEEKYPTKGNCPLKAPELNAELIPLLHKTAKNRDKYLIANQEMSGRGLVALGNAIGAIFNDENEPVDKDQLLEWLCDASSMFCDVNHQLSKTRKHQIYQHVDEKRKVILEQSETDSFLFGEDLGKRIKTATAAEKVGLY